MPTVCSLGSASEVCPLSVDTVQAHVVNLCATVLATDYF